MDETEQAYYEAILAHMIKNGSSKLTPTEFGNTSDEGANLTSAAKTTVMKRAKRAFDRYFIIY
jgi:hypothetical protein